MQYATQWLSFGQLYQHYFTVNTAEQANTCFHKLHVTSKLYFMWPTLCSRPGSQATTTLRANTAEQSNTTLQADMELSYLCNTWNKGLCFGICALRKPIVRRHVLHKHELPGEHARTRPPGHMHTNLSLDTKPHIRPTHAAHGPSNLS